MDRRGDLALAIGFMVLGITVVVLTTRISEILSIDPVGSRGFGYLLGVAMILGGGSLAIRRGLRWNDFGGENEIPSEGAGDDADVPASPVRPILVVAWTGAYIFSFEILGFVLATPIYLGVLLTMLQSKRPLLSRVLLPIVFTGIVYWVFAQLLRVTMPVGPLRPLFVEWGLVAF